MARCFGRSQRINSSSLVFGLVWVFCLSFSGRRRTRGERDLDLNNPVFQAVIAPFVVAFLVIGSSRLVGWRTGSEVLAGLGVAAGLLMAFIQLRGFPSLPPNSAPEKLFYLITLARLDIFGRRIGGSNKTPLVPSHQNGQSVKRDTRPVPSSSWPSVSKYFV